MRLVPAAFNSGRRKAALNEGRKPFHQPVAVKQSCDGREGVEECIIDFERRGARVVFQGWWCMPCPVFWFVSVAICSPWGFLVLRLFLQPEPLTSSLHVL